MPSFSEHISQAKRNLKFLQASNINSREFWDWQVTINFYVAVHLINAHLAQKANLHYRKHEEVNTAISPYNISPCQLPEDIYLSYMKLQGLARRARYLVNDDHRNAHTGAHFTYDRHFMKSIKHLDNVLKHFAVSYGSEFDVLQIDCIRLNDNDLAYFKKRT